MTDGLRFPGILFLLLIPSAGMAALQVYDALHYDSVYNFTTHAYQAEQIGSGVRFSFIAPAADSVALIADTTGAFTYSYKSIDFYGSDSTFSTAVNSSSGYYTVRYVFPAVAGTRYYFLVKPMTTDDYTRNFKVRFAANSQITVIADGMGTVQPTGTQYLWTNQRLDVQATPSSIAYFTHWNVPAGVTATDSFAKYTSLYATITSATVTAKFSAKPVNVLTFTRDTFNFRTDGGEPQSGVLFRFTAPTADTFYLTMGRGDATHNPLFRWVYYKGDSTFSTDPDSLSGSGNGLYFRSTAASQNLYFRIMYVNPADSVASFSIQANRFYTLSIQQPAQGSITPDGSFLMKSGESKTVTLTLSSYRYTLTAWRCSAGNATITDTLAMSTSIRIDSSDATVEADIAVKTIYDIGTEPVDFSYATQGTYASGGVLLRYTAPAADSFFLEIRKSANHYNYVYYYALDSTFSVSSGQRYLLGTNYYTFRSPSAGAHLYFRVYPASLANQGYQFTAEVFPFYTLTVKKELGGAVVGDTAMLLREDVLQTLIAPSLTGRYYFSNWSVANGTVTISDTTKTSVNVAISSDATLSAHCPLRPVQQITDTYVSYRYMNIAGGSRGGILFSFAPPAADSFLIDMRYASSHYMTIYYYGIDTACSTVVTAYPSTQVRSVPLSGEAGKTYYWRVMPTVTADTTDSMKTRFFQYHTLTIKKEIEGIGTIYRSKEIREDSSTLLDTTIVAGKYYFDRWEVESGTVDIANANRLATTVTVNSDAVVKAVYLNRPVTPVSFSWDTVGFQETAGGTHGGILLSFTSAIEDTCVFRWAHAAPTNLKLEYFGTDDRCSTVVASRITTTESEYHFRIHQAGTTHYFRILPVNAADTVDSVRMRISRFCTVLLSAVNGSVTPESTLVVESGTLSITARPDPYAYYLDTWTIIAGHAVIADTLATATSLTVDSVDVHLVAQFTLKTVYPITADDSVYRFGTNGGRPYNGGVVFSFSPPQSDSFMVIVSPASGSTVNYLIDYGTDATFTNAVDTVQGDTAYTIFNATSGQNRYFRVAPVDALQDNDDFDFAIRYEDVLHMTFSATSGGTVRPSGTVTVPGSFTVTDTAIPVSVRYYFDEWETVTGTADYHAGTDSTDAIITVAPHDSDAALRARFAAKFVHDLTTSNQTYTFSTDGYPSGGVLLRYVAPKADSFALQVTLPSVYAFTFEAYDTSSAFIQVVKSANVNALSYTHKFRAAAEGRAYYFRITTSSGNYGQNFTAHIDTTVLLSITNDGRGSTTPPDSVRMVKNGTVGITASPLSVKYYFQAWRSIDGDPSVTDTSAASTTVRVEQDSRIQAWFSEKTVYPVTSEKDTMSYVFNGAPTSSGGILLEFTAPRADSFAIAFDTAGRYQRNINVYYYDTSASFTGLQRSWTNRPKASQFGFRTRGSGESYYFRVEPYNASFYTVDSIAVSVVGYASVEIITDGRGTTTPSGTIAVMQHIPQHITATPSSDFYRFWKWAVLRGRALFDDTLAAATSFTVDTSRVILQAGFVTYGVAVIPKAPLSTLVRYDAAIPPGIFAQMTSERADSFYLKVEHYLPAIAKTLTYYGTDGTFRTAVATRSITSAKDTLFKFKALASKTGHYFKIAPVTANYSDSCTLQWIPFNEIQVVSDGGGTVTPLVPVYKAAGDTVHIATASIDQLFTFRNWEVAAGSAYIADSNAQSTWIRVDGHGDATVKARYNVKPHDTLIIENDGYGITVPFGQVFIDTARDTLVAAYPNSRWQFDRWDIVRGAPDLSDVSSSVVRVRCHGTAHIKAFFAPDSGARPSLVINSVTINDHPVIELVATLRDATGNALAGTDSTRFVVMQDGLFPPFTAANISEVSGISISLVIDRSLTMGENHRIDTALLAAETFIDALGPLDRAAIVSFSTGTIVEQGITGDKELLKSALPDIIPFGETAIRDGAYTGAQQLTDETNTRAVIIFSDGYENASTTALQEVIDFARDNDITIYSIALGAAAFALVDATLRPLADSTDGMLFYAREISELAGLYARIKADIEARYLIRYVSPDTVFDGDTHTVVLSSEVSGIVVQDTAYWNEDNRPPVITLTEKTTALLQVMQASAVPFEIEVRIDDDDSIVPVRQVYYRSAGSGNPYSYIDMAYVEGQIYSGIIPADSVNKPGLDFLVYAADSMRAKCEIGPFRINVENNGPVILHTPDTLLTAYVDLQIMAVVHDSDMVKSVIIHYKNAIASEFTIDTMTRTAGDTFMVIIDGKVITSAYLEYFIEATDSYDALTRSPAGTEYHVAIDQLPQIIWLGATEYYEGDLVFGRIIASDPESYPVQLVKLTSLPQEIECDSIGPAEKTIRWQTNARSHGDRTIVFSTADSRYTVRDTVVLRIRDVDSLMVITAPDRITATEGDTIRFTVSAYDPDGALVRFTAMSVPAGAQFVDQGNDSARFTWKTGSNDAGIHYILFTASDGSNEVTDSVELSIADSSFYPPRLHATVTDTVIASGKTVTLSIWATDDDHTIPSIILTGLPDGADFIKNVTGDSGIFTWNATGAREVILIAVASDQVDEYQSDTLRIIITVGLYGVAVTCLDTNANGYLDKLLFSWDSQARLAETLPQPGEWIDTCVVELYDGSLVRLNPLKLVRVDSMHMSAVLGEKTDLFHTGYAAARIVTGDYAVTRQPLPTVVTDIEDRAGPVIRQAVYYPGSRESGEIRRIIVYFSEPVVWLQVETQPSEVFDLFRDGKRDTAIFAALPAIENRFSRSAEIVLPYDIAIAVLRDSIALRPYASDERSHLADSTSWRTIPGDNNRHAPFLLEDARIDIAAMVYDTNGQGYLDKIVLGIPPEYTFVLPIPPIDSIVSSLRMIERGHREDRLLEGVAVKVAENHNELMVIIKEHERPLSSETTWEQMTIDLQQSFTSLEGIGFHVASVHDRAGPVIDRALVRAANIGVPHSFDTLHITFSEPVEWRNEPFAPDELFAYVTGRRTATRTAFDGLSSTSIVRMDSTSVVIVMKNGFSFDREIDSIRIVDTIESAMAIAPDRSGNVANVDNRAMSIQINALQDAAACPNPFIPGVSRDPFSGESGTLLIVQCEEPARDNEGEVTIFNALGSVVVNRRKMTVHASNDRWLTYLWDGKDTSGRYVGCGVYAARIEVRNRLSGKRLPTILKKIGVMRETE